MIPCRLLIHEPSDGPWNMAVDEVLLQDAGVTGGAAIRLYGWSQPTVSLGYFQPLRDRDQHPASADCAVVRRRTGGGAIVHDQELTYSVVINPKVLGLGHSEQIYRAVHDCWIEVLSDACRVPLTYAGLQDQRHDPPFLCFLRRSPWDICLGEWKIVGSAQRRLGKFVLQHGSILLKRSPACPEIPGISDLTGGDIDGRSVGREWSDRLARIFQLRPIEATLADGEPERINYIRTAQFGSASWTGKR
ncbi:MAG TPA: hypothetical protein VIY86_14210 [Pirellulaceae bacterium]